MTVAREFLRGIIDYAGLFPPASLDMAHAVAAFATYSEGDDRDLLGRFILPATRLDEFTSALDASRLTTENAAPWRLSVIPAVANNSEAERIREFNQAQGDSRSRARTTIDAVEMPVRSIDEIHRAVMEFGKFELFLEPTGGNDPSELLDGIAGVGAAAKIRTGGTTPGSTPSPGSVIRFIAKCWNLGLRFKATAGLHHALRDVYPLTYAPDSPRGTMYGYLNIFLVAAFMRDGLPEAALYDLLQESAPASISFDESGATWRGNTVDAGQLRATRERFALSFGSCSFTEPVEEARELHLI
jgi:hypothetical protein